MEELLLSVVECTRVNDVRQTEVHAAESLVPETSRFEVEIVIENLNDCVRFHLINKIIPYFIWQVKCSGSNQSF
jgi:hypothetical protein